MELARLEARLRAAVQPHDLLCHPFYQAWSHGTLTRSDLREYASQYRNQVDALPGLIRAASSQTQDPYTRDALARNLAEELGEVGPVHAALWAAFAAHLGATELAAPNAETRESAESLAELMRADEVSALAALWTYEMQTAHVAKTKHEGLSARYGITDPAALAFFKLHEQLDVHHAQDLLAALGRACGDDASKIDAACVAAAESAKAQWRFLDGSERARLAA
jgi:pyrroloquinoline-quinone synthase